jgi:hypothetical protein
MTIELIQLPNSISFRSGYVDLNGMECQTNDDAGTNMEIALELIDCVN